jgi:antitoxin component of RelBE/YafQ-DinJ toxin-antitoxin module
MDLLIQKRTPDLKPVIKTAKKKRTRTTNILSVSLEPELAEEARRAAQRLGMTVSGLIRQLLRQQVIRGSDLIIPIDKSEHESRSDV